MGESLKRYGAAIAAFAGAAGMSLGSILKGVGLDDWMTRWGFWPTFAAVSLGVLLLILIQQKQAMKQSLEAIERRADEQIQLMERRQDRQEQHHQEMIELIMDRHAAGLGEVRGEVEKLREDVAALRDQTGPQRRITLPPTPPTGR